MVQVGDREAIGRRANALMRAGFYSRDEVAWLSEYIRREGVTLDEIETLLANAEELARRA